MEWGIICLLKMLVCNSDSIFAIRVISQFTYGLLKSLLNFFMLSEILEMMPNNYD